MATTVVVGGIKPDLSILGDTQQFVFNKPNASTQCVNTTAASSTVSPQINLDFLNAATRGFRFSQSTTTAIPGGVFSLHSLQYQGTSYITIPLLTFNDTGSDAFAFKKAVKFESTCQSLTPVASTDVANKAYVDGKTLNSFVAPTSDLSLNNKKITSLARPTAASDAVTREYVRQMALCVCFLASTAPLDTIYDNGPTNNGIGATLTNKVFGSTLNLDGSWNTEANLGFLLIKNQTNKRENGIYKVKTAGSPTSPWVLVRAPGFDLCLSNTEDLGSNESYSRGLSFVRSGAVNEKTLWFQDGPYNTIGSQYSDTTFIKIAGPVVGVEEKVETLGKKTSLKQGRVLKKKQD